MAGHEAAEAGIRQVVEALVGAWNRHDARAYAACFTEDADFTNVFGVVAKGPGLIESGHAVIFRTLFRDSSVAVSEVTIRMLHPGIATADIRWEMRGSYDPAGQPAPLRHGLMNIIVLEGQTGWRIAVFHNQDLPPPERQRQFAELWKQ